MPAVVFRLDLLPSLRTHAKDAKSAHQAHGEHEEDKLSEEQFTGAGYLPMQNFPKISPSKSSVVKMPVTSPSA
jgi:hypothetical protein